MNMNSKQSRYEKARVCLLILCLFIGIGAVVGSVSMLVKPDGSILHMQSMLPYFQVLPFSDQLFQNYTFSGIALLCVNGITNLVAASLLICRKHLGVILGIIFGITLMLWICIQFIIFPFNFLSTSFFILGLAQSITGLTAYIFEKQESFAKREATRMYEGIGTNPNRLVIYFSRLGYTKKLAFEEAARTGACVYEVCSTERTQGTSGFWWCGRYAMHRWDMPIEKIKVMLSDYEHVTICTPIWVFHLAAPMRAFCRQVKGRIKEADYIIVHYQNVKYRGAAREMDELLDIKSTAMRDFRCHMGVFKQLD